MPDGKNVKLVLFDCDGTLVDSQHVIVSAMTRAFARAGIELPPREAILGIVGLSLVEAMRKLGNHAPDFPAEELAGFYRAAFHDLRDEGNFTEPMFPGMHDLVEALHRRDDVLIGMATGKSQRGVASVLKHHGMEGRFVTIQTADDAPSKPHPAMVQQAMAAVGAQARDTVLVGDTSYDMIMARAAGVGAIGVTWGYHPAEMLEEGGAHLLVNGAGELAEGLDALWQQLAHESTEGAGR
nr:HAD-IA family hydrolase [Ancylobacter sp. Lp-2]